MSSIETTPTAEAYGHIADALESCESELNRVKVRLDTIKADPNESGSSLFFDTFRQATRLILAARIMAQDGVTNSIHMARVDAGEESL